jgi:hypothetical protein
MTERALLPQFIREALEEGSPADETAEKALSHELALAGEPAALRTLLSLEEALEGGLSAPGLMSAASASAASASGSPALLARLEATLSAPPHRYAPFFASAAQLLDLPEADVIAQLARLNDPDVWTFAGLPGIARVKVAGGPRVAEAETLFVRFNPGVRFPEHQHLGLERVLVLEGSYEDSNGVLHRAGELREWPSETAHSFRVGEETCIFASVVFGRRFSSWPLRTLARVLGS